MCACGAQPGDDDQQWHENYRHAGNKSRFGWCGEAQPRRLKLIAAGEKQSGDGSKEHRAPINVPDVSAVKNPQAGRGQNHAHEVEEQGRDVCKRIFNENKGRAPDEDHRQQQQMRFH